MIIQYIDWTSDIKSVTYQVFGLVLPSFEKSSKSTNHTTSLCNHTSIHKSKTKIIVVQSSTGLSMCMERDMLLEPDLYYLDSDPTPHKNLIWIQPFRQKCCIRIQQEIITAP